MIRVVEQAFHFRFGSAAYDLASRTHLMGVLNVTPDSFSDGGRFFDFERALRRAHAMVHEGADFIDIGGESTRPGSDPLPAEEEIRRVVPLIERLVQEIPVPISIDTYKASVADAALNAGAVIINDISGLTFDADMLGVAARHNASVVIMHMQGTPKTMQLDPHYDDVVAEVSSFLADQAKRAQASGIRQVMIDPGIGFGKKLEHNLELMKRLREFPRMGWPVLVGPSRKSFLGTLLNLPVDQRVEGTAAAVAACILNGAHIIRVHDVKEMKRVAIVADSLKNR